MSWKVIFTKIAQKDAKKLAAKNLKNKAEKLIEIIKQDPYATEPNYEKLVGDLDGAYSRRINIKHRLVYAIDKKSKTVKVLRMWSHYE